MTELMNWDKHLVIQRDPNLGCIPTGYEWMLRVAEIPGIDFENFQCEFNLQANLMGDNNFESIAKAVRNRYPTVRIENKVFNDGREKVIFIRELIEKGIPCLLSLALQPNGGWHIMPIVYIDDIVIKTIWSVGLDGIPDIFECSLNNIINYHNERVGGKDIAWLVR